MQQCFDTLEVTTCNAVVEASCMNDRGNTKDNKMGIKNDDKDGPKIKGCTVAQIHGGPRTKQTQKNDSYGVIINRKSRREHNQEDYNKITEEE